MKRLWDEAGREESDTMSPDCKKHTVLYEQVHIVLYTEFLHLIKLFPLNWLVWHVVLSLLLWELSSWTSTFSPSTHQDALRRHIYGQTNNKSLSGNAAWLLMWGKSLVLT